MPYKITFIACGLAAAPLFAGQAASSMPALKPFPEQGVYERDGKRYECGLYPGGKNEMPEAHRKAGERLAAQIVPLSPAGQPDPNGRIALLAAGHSNPREYFGAYAPFIAAEVQKGALHPKVALASICKGGKMCQDWAKECRAQTPAGGPKETQVLFLLTSYHNASRGATEKKQPEALKMNFEARTQAMKEDLKVIVQAFAKTYPQLKLAYLGCDTWRGNSGLEPMVWEEAFAFKALIEEQLKGDPELAFEGPNRKAPWLAWGGYIWEHNPPKDRFAADGVHPSGSGKAFAYGRWHELLTKDSTAAPWFLKR
ncbi:MAG: hypothetical protein M5U26_27445 [Planctomycetota bacterium]|nr:hypothetical protein [Planctomycetota bacterium]